MIFLIGMPLAGKTYWAQQLASHNHLQQADLDVLVAEVAGMSIPELFTSKGEAAFRLVEQKVLQQVISEKQADILACGGGTPIFEDNMEQMKKAGCVVYLQAGVDTLLSRIDAQSMSRPLLNGNSDKRKALEWLLAERKNIYEQAHYTLDANKLSVSNFAEIIASCTNRH